MNATRSSDAVRAPAPPLAPAADQLAPGRLRAALLSRPALRHLALVPVLGLSAVFNINSLAQNGYANVFYSGAVKSMLRSLHNFVFVSFDPGGLVMVDKPPLGLWVQAASAKLFGFSPPSLLLPEAIAGVLTVALLYYVLQRRFGWVAGLAGLAFNTKTLAAYLVVPGIAVAYAVCAPGSLTRRLAQLAVAGLVMLAVSFSWITFVELTPASSRPYVGGSTDNSELSLTFE